MFTSLALDFDSVVDRLMLMTNINIHALELHRQSWAEQIKTAMTVNGGDLDNATAFTYTVHFFSFFWKVLFAFIPPASVFSGWLRFFTSLALIALMATIIGDLAAIFGCLIGLDDIVTGIIHNNKLLLRVVFIQRRDPIKVLSNYVLHEIGLVMFL